MIARGLILLSLLGSAPAAQADGFYTGNEAYSECQRSRTWCLDYVAGLADALLYADLNFRGHVLEFCPPDGLTNGQITDMLLLELRSRPEARHRPTAEMLWDALRRSFPCRN
jgi:hypothetical protein